MITNLLTFIVGIGFLYFGADFLIRSGKLIAIRLGVPTVIVGITIIAFGTSLPELIVSIIANIRGETEIVLGNIVGSNIANLGLVIGVSAFIAPIAFQYNKSRVDLYFLVFVTLLFSLLLTLGKLSIFHGILFLLLLTGYCFHLYRSNQNKYNGSSEQLTPGTIIVFILGIAGLWLGSNLFVKSAVNMAELLGVSKVAIGMTVVALGTSIPELATSIIAAAHGEPDIAIGNVIGSNLFNILAVMGSALLIRGIEFSFAQIWINVAIMLAFTLAMVLLIRKSNGISRPWGVLFFLGYIFSCYILFV
ncbi:MAG: calcium/sodium antiporter [FCB group bacterium]|nr:calcium/sodium antiporter [FCB group bacterium]